MTPDEIESQRRYLERGAEQNRVRVLSQMRSLMTTLEKAAERANVNPELMLYHHENMQNTILWTTWNCGLVDLLHTAHAVAAFDQQYPRTSVTTEVV